MRWTLPAVAALIGVAALFVPYQASVAGGPPGSVFNELVMEALASGETMGLALGAALALGALLPAMGLGIGAATTHRGFISLQRVCGVMAVLYAAVVYVGISMSLTHFSLLSSGPEPMGPLAYAIPATFGALGVLTLLMPPQTA